MDLKSVRLCMKKPLALCQHFMQFMEMEFMGESGAALLNLVLFITVNEMNSQFGVHLLSA